MRSSESWGEKETTNYRRKRYSIIYKRRGGNVQYHSREKWGKIQQQRREGTVSKASESRNFEERVKDKVLEEEEVGYWSQNYGIKSRLWVEKYG